MRSAKTGSWWISNSQRALANNSAAYNEKPDIGSFMKEWISLYDSKSGERGIFNRSATKNHIPERRDKSYTFGCNPCGEIILRPNGLCNLTECVLKENDDLASIKNKIRLVTILGTFQSTFTNFRYLRNIWKKNAEEERLLGVSITGIYDNKFMCTPSEELKEFLYHLKRYTIEVNKDFSNKLGINSSVAITTIKPSGSVSQLVNSSSGIHPRYSKYYIRRARGDIKDPLANFMKDIGIKCETEKNKEDSGVVFDFPIKSPENCITRKDITALESLELWKMYKAYYTEHNPSCTIYIRENEWITVADWVYKNFDNIVGLSFLPYSDDDHIYEQAPYEEITEEKYIELLSKMPKHIEWNDLKKYEKEDNTTSSRELSCHGNICEIR